MAITFIESGTSASQGLEWWPTTTGTVASATDQTINSPRSIKCTSGAAGATAAVTTPNGVLADAGSRYSLYVRFESLPTTNQLLLFGTLDSGGANVYLVGVSTAGVLTVYKAPGGVVTSIKTGSTLAAATWYRISVAHVITTTTNYTVKVWVHGILDITATNADAALSTIVTSAIRAGWRSASEGNLKSVWLAHGYADDSSALTEPGANQRDLWVTYKAPTTTNSNSFDTNLGTQAVNERPFSTTNGKQHAAISSAAQNYAIQDTATGDAAITGCTILGFGAFIWAKATAGGAGTPKITNNGSDTAITLTSAAALYTNYTASATYPSNAATVGMVATNNADDTFLYECGMLIAYTTNRTDHLLPLLGVGT